MSSKDHSRAPVIEGICAFQAERRAQFTTPGHKMGRGVAADVLSVLGDKAFSSDLAMTGAVDDRRASRGWLTQAQESLPPMRSTRTKPRFRPTAAR
jgi:arginine/lysine/ornithine decarboxylase